MFFQLGDVYAHIGKWQEAGQMWSDTLDTILGPYNVIEVWHQEIGGMSLESVAEKYGIHYILMAGGVILGKLIRCLIIRKNKLLMHNRLSTHGRLHIVLVFVSFSPTSCFRSTGSPFTTTSSTNFRLQDCQHFSCHLAFPPQSHTHSEQLIMGNIFLFSCGKDKSCFWISIRSTLVTPWRVPRLSVMCYWTVE